MIKAEKGVPFPKAKHNHYPWESMKIGESFRISVTSPQSNAWNASRRYKPKKFKAGLDEEGKQRIWRIE